MTSIKWNDSDCTCVDAAKVAWSYADTAATINDVITSYNTISNAVCDTLNATTKPTVSPETKTKFTRKGNNLWVTHYKDGHYQKERNLVADFKDIKLVQNTVIVEWADGTKTKTTLDSEDKYSLEQGISICLTKKLLGEDGSSLYNKLIKRALKLKAANEAAVIKAKQDKEEAKERKLRYEEKRRAKKLRKREEAIEIQKEAYLRAMREFLPCKE